VLAAYASFVRYSLSELVIAFPILSGYTCITIKEGGQHRMAETQNLYAQN